MEKNKKFHKELKELLKKFNAIIMTEDIARGRYEDLSEIVVHFDWDIDKEDKATPELVLGKWENGDN